MKAITLPWACLFSLAIAPAFGSDTEKLVTGCKELVGIYEKREKMKLTAGLTTSVSEALRAGYCMGVIDEYRRSKRNSYRRHHCRASDWLEQAETIATMPVAIVERSSVDELLETSCELKL